MTTQTFRVVRVRGGHSPVARIDGADEDGLEIHLEVKADAVDGASTDHVLVVNWSLHALAPARVAKPEPPAPDAGAPAPAARTAVDEEFMALMGHRPGAPPPTTPVQTAAESPAHALAAMLGLKTD